jgi:hypothetical protein
MRSGLFAHQIEATLAVREHFNDPTKSQVALVVLPTGAATNSARVLVITPSTKVSKQIGSVFTAPHGEAFLYKRGVVPGGTSESRVLPTVHVVQGDDLVEATGRAMALRFPLVVTNIHKVGGVSRVSPEDIPCDFDLVIVDEAHHYPAPTWTAFVDRFHNARILFLTGTPEHKGRSILPNQQLCMAYELSRQEAIDKSIIRNMVFDELDNRPEAMNPSLDERERAAFRGMAHKIRERLVEHDTKNPTVWHQGMVLAQTVDLVNSAEVFVEEYNRGLPPGREQAKLFVAGHNMTVVERFQGFDGKKSDESVKFRVLVVVGRLLEGFDHSPISVVGVAHNVSSRVLFEQFVGRAVRRTNEGDVATACIVTHAMFGQRGNFDLIDTIAEEEPEEED